MPELNGNWLGTMIYGPGFGQLEHESVLFALNIESDGEDLSGISREIDGIGMLNQPARVSGFAENGSINFVARYTQDAPAGQDRNGATAPSHGPEISFTGFWDKDTDEFSGEWVVLDSFTVLGNVFYENSGGHWRMHKQL